MTDPLRAAAEVPLAELVSLRGRVAVVTGGATGLGAAIVARLVEAGAAVVVADIDEAAADRRASLAPGSATSARVDVRSEVSVAALVASTVATWGRLDIWVNNAGVYPRQPLFDLTEADWDQVIDTNLKGSFLGSQAAARVMVSQPSGGVVINISSASAFRCPNEGRSHYIASKAGITGLTRSLAVELGPSRVRVLGVAPSLFATETTQAMQAASERPAALDDRAAKVPLRRLPEPDDIARVVVFAASDLSSLMTGTTLLVDGGQLAGG